MRKFTTLATATAIVLTSFAAVPAEARGRYHGGWGYRDRDHISTGEVIGGLLILGTIAAIASSASKDKAERRNDRYDPPYREPRQVDSITGTEPNDGGWYVTGTASRLGGEVRSFGCSYKNGRVVDVRFN